MDYKKLPKDEFERIYHIVPRACVDVVIQTPDGIVFTKRSIPPYQGLWHIPGGTILFMEPIEHAVKRIAKDELGVDVEIVKLLGTIEYINDGGSGRHSVSIAYQASVVSGEFRGGEQGEEIGFFKEIPDNCIPEQKEFLKSVDKHLR